MKNRFFFNSETLKFQVFPIPKILNVALRKVSKEKFENH